MKKNYLLGLIVVGLISLSVYSTYAMFTSSVETNDIVSLSASTLPTNSEIVEYERLTIKSKEKKVIEYTVNNNTDNSLYYGVWYEMINPSSINEDIVIGKSEDTQSDTLGQLSSGSNAKVLFVIENKTDSNIIVNVGVGYSETSSLNLPTNRNLITEIYEESVLATEYITELYNNASKTTITNNNINYSYATSVGLMNDRLGGTTTSLDGGNIRYYGANSNNYIWFNNELWRIIGVFDVASTYGGPTEKRLKIIRDEPIGNYSWDNKPSGTGSSTSGNGSNDWTDCVLMEVLNNGPYWNRTSGTCPSGLNGATTSCDFSSIGLTSDAKVLIDDAIWNLGGSSKITGLYADDYYAFERGTKVYSGRKTEWKGKIALMYPSDYLYSSNLGSCTSNGYYWDTSGCADTSWLFDSQYEWLLSPDSYVPDEAFYVYNSGYVLTNRKIANSSASRPALYLKSTVLITGGDGSSSNPYILSI